MIGKGLLLDTGAAVWLLTGTPMAEEARQAIVRAATDASLYISPITAWEISMLAAKGRIALAMPPQKWVDQALAHPGLRLADLSPQILVESNCLPAPAPEDPADRIIIATARCCDLKIITRDPPILAYAAQGHAASLPC